MKFYPLIGVPPASRQSRRERRRAAYLAVLLCGATAATTPALAADWEPFPTTRTVNDFGGIGLIQTPTARTAPEGQLYVGGGHLWPYDRYFVTLQATPWLEGTLRYSSVGNRLYSNDPGFSGDQSLKDRGIDLKLALASEGRLRPAIAVGARDFLGTGLFSAEYIVLSKEAGPFDTSLGVGWGNLGTRAHLKNPLRLLSSSFRDRGTFTPGGGTLNSSYLKGEGIAFFGGVTYDTPIKGLSAKIEYDPNDYQSEGSGNRFPVASPINVGVNYAVRSWLHLAASFERGNRFGFQLTLTTNVDRPSRVPKIDPPAPKMTPAAEAGVTPATAVSAPSTSEAVVENSTSELVDASVRDSQTAAAPPRDTVDEAALAYALAVQGASLYGADFHQGRATLYVAQTRYRNMATGLGRIARAAFSTLPQSYAAVSVVFVENGVETMMATVYRSELEKALQPGRGSIDELLMRTEFDEPPLALSDADYKGPASTSGPRFFYGIRPGLRTTLGRPEQFILYQLWLRLNGTLEISRGLSAAGSFGLNLSDNFDKLRIGSDSLLPKVRSDIKEYLRQGRTSIPYLQADYNFNIAPSLYGHVYGGLLEEMFGGVGGEVLYRPYDENWAIGAEVSWVKQRDFDQYFSFRDYEVVTGHVTGFYHLESLDVDAVVKAGRYLAKDWGATFQLSKRFRSGIAVGAFATFTDVSAAEFGEGRFDKGLFITIPLDILYIRNVRSGVGLLWRPLIRDGGQMLIQRRPLLDTTGNATMYSIRRDWREILD